MPELPEVETVCRGLAKALTGARITAAAAHRADLRAPLPLHLAKQLQGLKIVAVRRRAKYILIDLDNQTTLLMHLGMSGRIVLSQKDLALQKHDHITMTFANGLHAKFNDPRRFGYCDLVATDRLNSHKLLRSLGIEPLEKTFTSKHLATLLKKRTTSIKAALLDQRLVVGIGNIYACEALFHARISPLRNAKSLTQKEVSALTAAVRKVLSASIKAGGSSLRDYRQADGELGYFQKQFAVYGKEDQECPRCLCDCGKTKGIRRVVQNGRSSFFCATKQK